MRYGNKYDNWLNNMMTIKWQKNYKIQRHQNS